MSEWQKYLDLDFFKDDIGKLYPDGKLPLDLNTFITDIYKKGIDFGQNLERDILQLEAMLKKENGSKK